VQFSGNKVGKEKLKLGKLVMVEELLSMVVDEITLVSIV